MKLFEIDQYETGVFPPIVVQFVQLQNRGGARTGGRREWIWRGFYFWHR